MRATVVPRVRGSVSQCQVRLLSLQIVKTRTMSLAKAKKSSWAATLSFSVVGETVIQ